MVFQATRNQFACAALSVLLIAGASSQARAQSAAVLPGQTITEGMVNEAFGLVSCELVNLDVPAFHDGALHVTVPFAGVPYELALHPHSNRSDRYEVQVHDGSGVVRNIAPGPVLTKRGEVVGLAGSRVTASLTEGLSARVRLPDGSSFQVAPVSEEIAGAPARLHAVYHIDSVLSRPENDCGLDLLPNGGRVASQEPVGAPKISCNDLWKCEVAVDTDYEFYVDKGSTANVESSINAVINDANDEYERDVSITHEIVLIIVYTTNTDPYTTNDPSALLGQLRTNWRNNHAGVARDIVHMFSGRNLSGSVIGIAWLGVICNTNYGYSLVENISGASCRADLSAHELGHNWNADHCSCPSNTMNSYLTCANQFSAGSITTISNFRNNKGCLSCDDADVCQADIGYGGPGTGILTLCGGDLSPGTTADLEITNAYNYGMVYIQVGLSNNPTGFKGGLLVPVPGWTLGPFYLDAAGALLIPGVPGGTTLTFYMQAVYQDFNQALYWGLTNALMVQRP